MTSRSGRRRNSLSSKRQKAKFTPRTCACPQYVPVLFHYIARRSDGKAIRVLQIDRPYRRPGDRLGFRTFEGLNGGLSSPGDGC
jgi:hypothetical protein